MGGRHGSGQLAAGLNGFARSFATSGGAGRLAAQAGLAGCRVVPRIGLHITETGLAASWSVCGLLCLGSRVLDAIRCV